MVKDVIEPQMLLSGLFDMLSGHFRYDNSIDWYMLQVKDCRLFGLVTGRIKNRSTFYQKENLQLHSGMCPIGLLHLCTEQMLVNLFRSGSLDASPLQLI